MRLVAATPDSSPVADTIKAVFDSISQDDLRDVVKRTAVPRVDGTPGSETVRKVIIDLLSGYHGDRFRIEVDGVGNVVAGDPRRARILIGAHYDGVLGGSDVQVLCRKPPNSAVVHAWFRWRRPRKTGGIRLADHPCTLGDSEGFRQSNVQA